MNKLIATFLLAAAVNITAYAAFSPVHPSKMDEYNKKTGGLVIPPDNSSKVVIVDARRDQGIVLTNILSAAGRILDFNYSCKTIAKKDGECPFGLAKCERKAGAGAVLLYYEDDTMPALAVYPEEAITLINVTALKDNDEVTYRRRLNKEFWRGIALALGGYAASVQGATVLAPIYSLQDLDELKAGSLSPSQIGAIHAAKSRLRIFSSRPVPYSRACREGWAPAPTNDVQRSIYERCSNHAAKGLRDVQGGVVKEPIVVPNPHPSRK